MCKPVVYAHRGASAVCFENTMAAFQKAVEQGADGIELDVQLTEDGIPVVVHDPDLSRLAGIRRLVSSMTSAELTTIRVGRKYSRFIAGHHIPTLIEAVAFCDQHNLALNVELKETVSDRLECLERIIEIASGMENVHISSFDYRLLEKVKEIDSQMETAYLLRKKGVEWDHLERYAHADGFHFHKRLLKEPYLPQVIQTGKRIRVYGVTGKESITLDPPPFITGWITDFPDQFHEK